MSTEWHPLKDSKCQIKDLKVLREFKMQRVHSDNLNIIRGQQVQLDGKLKAKITNTVINQLHISII